MQWARSGLGVASRHLENATAATVVKCGRQPVSACSKSHAHSAQICCLRLGAALEPRLPLPAARHPAALTPLASGAGGPPPVPDTGEPQRRA